MIDYKYYLFGTMIIFLTLDIMGLNYATMGVFAGWIIGLMTATQWNIKKEENERKSMSCLGISMEDYLKSKSSSL